MPKGIPRSSSTCSLPECEGKVRGNGMCAKHYTRWRRWGDPHHVTQRPYHRPEKGSVVPHLQQVNEAKKSPVVVRDGQDGRVCASCGEWVPLSGMAKDASRHDGLDNRCASCTRAKGRRYYHAHVEEITDRRRTPEYREAANAYQSQWVRNRVAVDENYRLTRKLRGQLWKLLTGRGPQRSMQSLLGCDRDQLRAHLEARFTEGMSWDNYGHVEGGGWEIDHVRPCISFDLTDMDQRAECFHYSNLQPLWASENSRKGAKP